MSNVGDKDTQSQKKHKFQVPHVYVIMFTLIIISAIATYIVPSGEYERAEVDGQEVVVDGSYSEIAAEPVGFLEIFQSVHQGMVDGAEIIFFIFIIGGAFGIFRATGALENGMTTIANKMKRKDILLIPVLMTLFAIGGAVFGMAEETIPYIKIIVPLVVFLGYDSMLGAAIVLCGASAGFSAAFMNPFTVGVAQGIAELPIYSGFIARLVFWFIFVSTSIIYVMLYARKIKKDPTKSLMYEEDKRKREGINNKERKDITPRQMVIIGILILTIITLAYGVVQHEWFIKEISGLFLLMGIIMGIVARMRFNEIAEYFIKGCEVIVLGALIVGFAFGIQAVLAEGKIIDTILYSIANTVSALPNGLTAIGMYISQALINFIVPSGSGQAALTMPIMVPLSDLVGVSRQTAVLAFQFGDGISNILTPTSGYFMAGLAAAGISWIKWLRWIWPLIIIQYILGAIFVTVAHIFIF
jgi:uncharacterized ion transporter superfamily protein YfcC